MPNSRRCGKAHRFDEGALRAYMADHVDGYAGESLKIRQFEGGQSNPTFLVEAPGGEYVMRKQPPGQLLPSAHQVDREYRVMDAAWTHRRPGAEDGLPVRGTRA